MIKKTNVGTDKLHKRRGKKHSRVSGCKRGISLYEVSRELVCIRFMKLKYLHKLNLVCIQADKLWDLEFALQERDPLVS